MLSMESRVEIEVLARQGKGIREIARLTGLARNTVREIVRGRSDGQYGPRGPRATKLDAHKPYLEGRLERAGDQRLCATVLLRELRERGYDGGVTQWAVRPPSRREWSESRADARASEIGSPCP